MNRRHFLAATGAGTAALATARADHHAKKPAAGAPKPPHTGPNRIGVSSYSFWGFRRKDLRDLHTNLEHAARMGFDGLEILQRQFEEHRTGPPCRRSSATPLSSASISWATPPTKDSSLPDKEKRTEATSITPSIASSRPTSLAFPPCA